MNNTKQNALNFASLFVYFALLLFVGFLLKRKGFSVTDLSVREIIIIMLASYRLTRILVFEKILKFFRDFVKSNQRYYILNTVRFIITCPWCAGVWITLIIIVFYYLIPYGIFLVYILAISGVASFLVLIANLVGLSVEGKQHRRPKKDE